MKKMLKGINIIVIASLLISIISFTPVYGNANSKKLHIATTKIDECVFEYAQTIISDLLKSFVGNEEIYGVEINNYQNVYLGSPFRVFTPAENDNYYFPLIEDDTIKCMLVVGKNEDGFSATLAKDFSEELNLLSTDTEYVLYSNGTDIFAVNEDSCTLLRGNLPTENNIDFKFICSNVLSEEGILFCNVYVCQKVNIIISTIEQISTEKMNSLSIMASLAYTPSFQVNQTNWKLLAAMNYWEMQKDNNGELRDLCWAATVATIANYRNGTHLRAYTVADDMGIEYDAGASPTVMNSALRRYGVTNYQILPGRMTWSKIKSNIDVAYPIALGAVGIVEEEEKGHMVTIIGYTYDTTNLNGTIQYWNSATGYIETCTVEASGNVYISYGGYQFRWEESLSRY